MCVTLSQHQGRSGGRQRGQSRQGADPRGQKGPSLSQPLERVACVCSSEFWSVEKG